MYRASEMLHHPRSDVEVRVEAQELYHHRVLVLLLRLAKSSPTPCPKLENRMHQKEASIDHFIEHILH
ncbi:hypothetical protein C4D60_Mb07t02040 [Musa balbisiana]|uniref:Uncharacterized protein n=1 Tax=Musa balbisiana TaxID=52838 RepID=A0A4S8JCS7_MUSBA|nr:hypothetical protein C4D60_Mb07t02020 [Musa balbisiana]THU59427.1 hypothetical protein C4D60_Mb07t02040 [Musa balbisiana]